MNLLIDSVTVSKGDKIKFTTINTFDPRQVYIGTVEGFVSIDLARSITDVDNYQNQVLVDTPAAPNLDNVDFIIVKFLTDSNVQTRVAFATSWIATGTTEVLTNTKNIDFRVYGITDAKALDVIQILTESGFRVTLV